MSGTDLVAVETLKAAEVFAPGGVEKLLAKVMADVRAHKLDASTDEGRAEIKSLAYKVARSKTALDDLGKDFVAEMKRAAATVDADRRTIRDRLDALRDEVRKPVDDWEAVEESRIAKLVAGLEELKAAGEFTTTEPTVADIDCRLALVAIARAGEWQEFAERAGQLVEKVSATLAATRESAVRREAERAELERLRKAEADRLEAERVQRLAQEQRERDDRIAAEAAAAEKRKAEEAIARAAEETAQAEARARQMEADAKAAAEKAERDRVAAAEQAQRNQDAAVEAERKRVADVQAAEATATAAREKDRSHKAKINRAAMNDLVKCNLLEEQARAVVMAIARGEISNVKIFY